MTGPKPRKVWFEQAWNRRGAIVEMMAPNAMIQMARGQLLVKASFIPF